MSYPSKTPEPHKPISELLDPILGDPRRAIKVLLHSLMVDVFMEIGKLPRYDPESEPAGIGGYYLNESDDGRFIDYDDLIAALTRLEGRIQ